eukprot:1825763-Pleurochrysis_carterae.AAC.1
MCTHARAREHTHKRTRTRPAWTPRAHAHSYTRAHVHARFCTRTCTLSTNAHAIARRFGAHLVAVVAPSVPAPDLLLFEPVWPSQQRQRQLVHRRGGWDEAGGAGHCVAPRAVCLITRHLRAHATTERPRAGARRDQWPSVRTPTLFMHVTPPH